MRKTVCVAVIAVCAIIGCSSSVDPYSSVTVTASSGLYLPGDLVAARLYNGSNESIGYGACALRLEKNQADAWMLVGPEAVNCIDLLYVLGPKASVTIQIPVDKSLPSGIYRIRATIYPKTSAPTRDVTSGTFVVRDAA